MNERSESLPEWPPELAASLGAASDQFHRNLLSAFPETAPVLLTHLKRVPSRENTVSTCLAVRSFPAFSMPYWLLEQAGAIDRSFLTDLCLSTLNGYFFVRLLDNVADGDGPPILRQLLPLGGYFFDAFCVPYRAYFGGDHAFWASFSAAWAEQAEAAAREPLLDDITLALFAEVSARKFAAAKIPLAAAAFQSGRDADMSHWATFVDTLGALSQLANDLFDWHHDNEHGIATLIQSEYRRQREVDETLPHWVATRGFDWASAELDRLAAKLAELAIPLGPLCEAWVRARRDALQADLNIGRRGLELIELLAYSTEPF